ncbi:MAG: virulence protein RhuM/Fic/DOC family protein [Candidatus Paceibacterota bacterium]
MKKEDKMTTHKNKKPVIYQTKDGALELRGDFDNETVWATQAQIAVAFDVDVRTVNEHISNVYNSKELTKVATIRKFRIVRKEGGREVSREVMHYNLDAIISVGYRVNSKIATKFRQWATKTLHQYIVEGYTLNPKRISHNYDAFMEAVSKVQSVLPSGEVMDGNDVLELVKLFADTWFSLDAYDKELLEPKKVSKKKVQLTADELKESLFVLKRELIQKREATENFAQARSQQSLEGIVGNVMQSFGGQAVYPTVQGKAAHLLYFIIKNHPFVDGNKRSGAYAFVWFLHKARVLNTKRLTPTALTALTLLIAESNPSDKEKVVALVTMLISR